MQWSSIFHIKTLFDGMVIDFHMFSYRDPLQRYWSSIFHIEALCKCTGHRSFISRPSSMEWSLIFICFHIEALYKGTGHRSFISRPSTNAMVIDLSYQDPLRWNGHWFSYVFISRPSTKVLVIDLSYRGLLQMQWSSIFHIKTLFDGMVIDFHMFSYRDPLQRYWSSIFHIETLCKCTVYRSFISRPSSMEWSLFFLNVLHWCDFFLEPRWN